MFHQLTETKLLAEDEESGVLAHWQAHCACGFVASTTLGSGSFNLTDSFARSDMSAHVTFMNKKEAK